MLLIFSASKNIPRPCSCACHTGRERCGLAPCCRLSGQLIGLPLREVLVKELKRA